MAALTVTAAGGTGAISMTINTLTSSDTFTYEPGDIMTLRNPTGGSLTPSLDGDGSTSIGIPGYGTLAVSGGRSLGAIAAAGERIIFLDTIKLFLLGLTTITGGTGLICTIARR